MMFRAPCRPGRPRTPPRRASFRSLLARLLLVSLSAVACTKEAPREPPPRADEMETAPAPEPSAAPPPPAVSPEPAERQLREEKSSAPSGVGSGQAAPAKPAAPAAKSRPRSDAVRRAAPSESAAGADQDDSVSPESLRQQLSKAVDLSTPDCPSARERKQAICDLAAQLCQLVDRDPDVASVESYCADARQRCNEAERRTAERCPR